MRRVQSKVARAILVPDVSRRSWDRLRPRALDEVASFHADVIISTSPPHSIHALGRAAARQLRLPWVADLRDPYLGSDHFGPTGSRRLLATAHRRFERSIYDEASLVIHAHELHYQEQIRRYPSAIDRLLVVPNGVPSAALSLLSARKSSDPAGCCRIVTVGSCGKEAFVALAAAVQRSPGDVTLEHAGHATEAQATAADLLGTRFHQHGLVLHSEALALIANADILALPQTLSRRTMISSTSRLPEFMATGKPVLVANPQLGDRRLLDDYYADGWTEIDPPDLGTAWASAIRAARAGRFQPELKSVERVRSTFNRDHQAEAVRDRILELLQ